MEQKGRVYGYTQVAVGNETEAGDVVNLAQLFPLVPDSFAELPMGNEGLNEKDLLDVVDQIGGSLKAKLGIAQRSGEHGR